jgi:hypothetical protein
VYASFSIPRLLCYCTYNLRMQFHSFGVSPSSHSTLVLYLREY